jgi:Mg/Co/Ni transporter MgtE
MKYIFQHQSDVLNRLVEWTWKDERAIHWKTYKPKITDVKILTELNKDEKKLVIAELHKQIMDREHPPKNNKSKIRVL